MPSKLIELRQLAVGYQDLPNPILENLNQEISSGEVICLIGENGIGKTTLLKTLCGLQPSLRGEIFIKGRSIENYSAKELATQISVVLTEKSFPYGLTAQEVLELARGPYTDFWGRLSSEDLVVIKRVVDLVQLHDLLAQKVTQLSDGQKQKLMIARALVQDTEIIFLDEPTTFLDLNNQIEILLLLRDIASKFNKTILMTSHHWELILELSTKLWIIDTKTKQLNETLAEQLILNGDFQYYFNLKSAHFDRLQGRFRLEAIKAIPCKLVTDDDLQRKWILNALGKWGYYEAKEGEESQFEILHHGEKYILRKSGQEIERSHQLLTIINSLRFH